MPFEPLEVLVEEFEHVSVLRAPVVYIDIALAVRVTVPQGFLTDWASIPRLLWLFFDPRDPAYRRAAVVHDWNYATRRFDRVGADRMLYTAAREEGTGLVRALLVLLGVRLGGFFAYWSAAERQAANRTHYEAALRAREETGRCDVF